MNGNGGTLILSGSSNYSGGTTVQAGTLVAASGSALGTGNLTVSSNTTFAYLPTAPGPLHLGSLTLQDGSTIGTFVAGTPSQSVIATSSPASVTGTITVSVSGIPGVAFASGKNNLITAPSGLDTGSPTYDPVFSNATNFLGSLIVSDTAIAVQISSATPSSYLYWNGGFSGSASVRALSDGIAKSNWATSASGDVPAGFNEAPEILRRRFWCFCFCFGLCHWS